MPCGHAWSQCHSRPCAMKTLHISIAGFRPGLEPNLLAAGLAKSTQDTAEFSATKADLTLEGGAHSQSKLPALPAPQAGPWHPDDSSHGDTALKTAL